MTRERPFPKREEQNQSRRSFEAGLQCCLLSLTQYFFIIKSITLKCNEVRTNILMQEPSNM